MTEPNDEYQDQDAEPTMTAPEEGRPDATVADDRPPRDGDEPESGEPTGPPE